MRIALLGGTAAILGALLTVGIYVLGLSEPGLRVPLVAAGAIGTMFLMRAGSAVGPLQRSAGRGVHQ